MMLSVTLAYGLLLAELGGGEDRIGFERVAGEIALLAVMAFFVVRAPENFRLPQIDSSTLSAADEQALKTEFRGILPLENDPWDNTIAKLPESEDLQWEYMLPTYTSLNVSQKSRILTSSAKSRNTGSSGRDTAGSCIRQGIRDFHLALFVITHREGLTP